MNLLFICVNAFDCLPVVVWWYISHPFVGFHCKRRWWGGASWRIYTRYDFFYWVSGQIFRKWKMLVYLAEICWCSCRQYVNLQNIYHAKAEVDFLVIERLVRSTLKKIGRDSNSIPRSTIKSFCKNARKLKVSLWTY